MLECGNCFVQFVLIKRTMRHDALMVSQSILEPLALAIFQVLLYMMLYCSRCTSKGCSLHLEGFLAIIFISSQSQVFGCYDSGAQLYRWAEMTGRDWEHHHKEPDPEVYSEALMKSTLWMLRVRYP